MTIIWANLSAGKPHPETMDSKGFE